MKKLFVTKKLLLSILLFVYTTLWSQSITKDSIRQQSFDKIVDSYYNATSKNDKKKAFYYASLYLEKAKIYKKNKIEHVYGHYLMSVENEKKIALKHLDSIIVIANNLTNKKKYPAAAYLLKGNVYYNSREFDKALQNYLIALDQSRIYKNKHIETISNNNIGLIKLERTGNKEESLEIFRKCLRFYKKKANEQKYNYDYLALLYALSENFRLLNQLDSSQFYTKKGFFKARKYHDKFFEDYFTFSEGINQVLLENYTVGLDSLTKSYHNVTQSNGRSNSNLIIANYYMGKVYLELNQKNKTTYFFKKMDSVYEKNKIYFPEIRKAFEYNIDLAKKNKDIKEELKYVNKILQLDSLNHNDYKSLSKILKEKYDNQTLLDEKTKLQSTLSKTHKLSVLKTYLLYIGGFLFLIVYGYFYRKNKKFKALFKKVIEQQNKVEPSKTLSKTNSKITIPKNILKNILDSLLHFEQEKGYLQQQLTSFDLAKKLGTNKKYLTTIINTYKGKTFPIYINDLRIINTIERLKKEPKFREYTIHHIAQEAGFSNTQSFSHAFFKYTNIKPSQFIKELKRNTDSLNL